MKKLYFLLASLLIISSAAFAKNKGSIADSTKYVDYFGKYKFDAGSPVDEAELKMADTTLTLSTAMGDATLDMLGTDSFHMSYMDGIVTFKRNADKKVIALHISVSGTELDAVKEVPAGTTMLRREDLVGEKKTGATK